MSDNFSKDRRTLIKGLGLLGLGALAWPLYKYIGSVKSLSTAFSGTSPQNAHAMFQASFPEPSETTTHQIVIVGSGIAALAAAKSLHAQGFKDFIILEQEAKLGGNSSWGTNGVSEFPVAAHYLPILSNEASYLKDFLVEENIITHFDDKGLPYYNELYLCHDLKERLYINGTWQEGLIPSHGINKSDEIEIERFFKLMDEYKSAKGHDGKYAFSIPVALSSKDSQYIKLDNITMAMFLDENAFHSPYLRWYINYCCRDDYGAGINDISAWAGLHYFSSRRAQAANADSDALLTWPQGNGFLAQRLAKEFTHQIKTQSLVYALSQENNGYLVKYYDQGKQQSFAINAQAVILATPRFVAHKICASQFKESFNNVENHVYSPWLVANVTIENVIPGIAWDNVSYYSHSLGYVDTAHQQLSLNTPSRIITYYLPLDALSPKEARKQALTRDLNAWKDLIMSDLKKMHPHLDKHILHIDVRLLGHAMIRPTVNQIWERSQHMTRHHSGLFFAHSDMSGISLFEEAFWQGQETAKSLINYLKTH